MGRLINLHGLFCKVEKEVYFFNFEGQFSRAGVTSLENFSGDLSHHSTLQKMASTCIPVSSIYIYMVSHFYDFLSHGIHTLVLGLIYMALPQ